MAEAVPVRVGVTVMLAAAFVGEDVTVDVGRGVWLGRLVKVGVFVAVAGSGVRVGRGVSVGVGVGDWYQRGVGVGTSVGGTMGEGVISTSGG